MSWLEKIRDWFISVWKYLQEMTYTGTRCNMCTKHLNLLGDEIVLGIRGNHVNFYICEDCANEIAAGIDVGS